MASKLKGRRQISSLNSSKQQDCSDGDCDKKIHVTISITGEILKQLQFCEIATHISDEIEDSVRGYFDGKFITQLYVQNTSVTLFNECSSDDDDNDDNSKKDTMMSQHIVCFNVWVKETFPNSQKCTQLIIEAIKGVLTEYYGKGFDVFCTGFSDPERNIQPPYIPSIVPTIVVPTQTIWPSTKQASSSNTVTWQPFGQLLVNSKL